MSAPQKPVSSTKPTREVKSAQNVTSKPQPVSSRKDLLVLTERRRSSFSIRSSPTVVRFPGGDAEAPPPVPTTSAGVKKASVEVPGSRSGSFHIHAVDSGELIGPDHKPPSPDQNPSDSKADIDLDKKKDAGPKGWRRFIGIFLAISSSSCFALASTIVKAIPEYHPFSVTFWRFQGIFLPSLPVVLYYWLWKKEEVCEHLCPMNIKDNLKTFVILTVRSVLGVTTVSLQFYALQYISLADCAVITFSTPVLVCILSHIFLHEKSGIVPYICGAISLCGVFIITRPPFITGGNFDRDNLIGTGFAAGSLICGSTVFLLLRYLRKVHFSVVTGFFGVYSLIQCSIMMGAVNKFDFPRSQTHWWFSVALASLTFIGLTLITLSFHFENAGTIALCRTFDIVFSFIWQFVFLGKVPDLYSWIGGAIVILAILIAGFRIYLEGLEEDHPTRVKLRFFLK